MQPADEINDPFNGLLGQHRAKVLLQRSLHSGRIAHAYLFKGPPGIGKKLYAAAMARAINCRTAGPAGICTECSSCRKFLSGNHPDYRVERPEKEVIKIEQIRTLAKALTYPPYESSRRVVVVEDVHTMRPEAANSMLKTLEEPPEGNVLILTAETSKSVLPTINSRCQVVPFFALTQEETASILTTKHGLDSEQAILLARLSEGSPGKALLLNSTEMIAIWAEVVAGLGDDRFRRDEHCATILTWAGRMADLKENLGPLLGLFRLWLRDLLSDNGVLHHGGSRRSSEQIFQGLAALDQAERELARNCNRALVCEILLFRLQ